MSDVCVPGADSQLAVFVAAAVWWSWRDRRKRAGYFEHHR